MLDCPIIIFITTVNRRRLLGMCITLIMMNLYSDYLGSLAAFPYSCSVWSIIIIVELIFIILDCCFLLFFFFAAIDIIRLYVQITFI